MAKAKKGEKSKKSTVRVRDLKASKNPKGGIIAVGPQQGRFVQSRPDKW